MGLLDRFRRAPSIAPSEEPALLEHTSAPIIPNQGEEPNHVSVYLHSSRWEELLNLDPNGMLPFYLKEHEGNYWLAENSTGLLVNVANRALKKLGLWTCTIRGIEHAPGVAVVGPAVLVREADNEHDKNAVAIHQNGQRIGYYNRGMAPALARTLDAGTKLTGYVVSTSPAKVMAADAPIMDWLKRKLV